MKLLAIIALCTLNFLITTCAKFKFTNFECEEHDKPFATIPVCKLKLVQRGVVAMDLHVRLHQVPVWNITVNNQLLKKANGYRPFLFNVTKDFCHVMRNTEKYPYVHIYMSTLAKYSNMNHTCPYDHDIILKRFILKDEMFKLIPVPPGDYLIAIKVYAYNDLKATIKVYIKAN